MAVGTHTLYEHYEHVLRARTHHISSVVCTLSYTLLTFRRPDCEPHAGEKAKERAEGALERGAGEA
jgi:hypothetical protein